MQYITKDEMNYILSHTHQRVYITVVNKQHKARSKKRYITVDNNVKHILDNYNKEQAEKIIYQSELMF
jgi:hypothetical protein